MIAAATALMTPVGGYLAYRALTSLFCAPFFGPLGWGGCMLRPSLF